MMPIDWCRDMKAGSKEKQELEPLRVFRGHSAWVEVFPLLNQN